MMQTPLAKPAMSMIGIHRDRKLAPFQRRTFLHHWRSYRQRNPVPAVTRGKVVYFHDTFTTYNYPKIGLGAVKLLEAAGFEVIIEQRRACCGRPMLSKGLVEAARKSARRNVSVLADYARQGIPIVGTEPSCILTLRDEYRDLLPGDADMEAVASQTYMFDEFLAKLEADGDLGISWKETTGPEVFFHGHCHQKALIGVEPSMVMFRASGCRPVESGAGCCGMAGSFGYEAEHYDVSKKIGDERLFPAIANTAMGVQLSYAGVSCHQQIEHFTGRPTSHIAEVLADRVDTRRPWQPNAQPATNIPEIDDPAVQQTAPTDIDTAHAKNQQEGPA
jgi:Fe-S oxidoreductase